jgi:5'-3' exonuclease
LFAEKIKKELTTESAIEDFILLCFLVGNDFLPQLPSLEILNDGIDLMIEAYKKTCIPTGLVNKNTIQLNGLFFRRFCAELATYEEDALKIKYLKRKSYHNDELLNEFFTERDQKVFCNFEGYKNAYYNKKLKGVSVERVCDEYLKGIQWVIQYYCTGVPCWSWFYPFSYGPFAADLVHSNSKPYLFSYTPPLEIFEQLLAVLPPRSVNILPRCLQSLPLKELSMFYPDKCIVDVSGKRADWEGIVILPAVDLAMLRRMYSERKQFLSAFEKERNKVEKIICYRKISESKTYKTMFGSIPNCQVVRKVLKWKNSNKN